MASFNQMGQVVATFMSPEIEEWKGSQLKKLEDYHKPQTQSDFPDPRPVDPSQPVPLDYWLDPSARFNEKEWEENYISNLRKENDAAAANKPPEPEKTEVTINRDLRMSPEKAMMFAQGNTGNYLSVKLNFDNWWQKQEPHQRKAILQKNAILWNEFDNKKNAETNEELKESVSQLEMRNADLFKRLEGLGG